MRIASILYHQWLAGGWLVAALTRGAQPDSNWSKVREITNSVGMKLVFIPPGEFRMGSPESEFGREAQEVLSAPAYPVDSASPNR